MISHVYSIWIRKPFYYKTIFPPIYTDSSYNFGGLVFSFLWCGDMPLSVIFVARMWQKKIWSQWHIYSSFVGKKWKLFRFHSIGRRIPHVFSSRAIVKRIILSYKLVILVMHHIGLYIVLRYKLQHLRKHNLYGNICDIGMEIKRMVISRFFLC